MNILLFLTPKDNIAYIYSDFTLRQTLEKMEHNKYSAVPIIDRDGRYAGTITEGDILWTIKNELSLSIKKAEKVPIMSIERKMDNLPVRIDTGMEELITMATNQNFVPVVDDRGVFIGIVTRKDIIKYIYSKTKAVVYSELKADNK
ncbi:MAG: hypothetical protein A2Y17_06645 [Clostridiales bacterium GWF2_38_85]|nr:MAG: hypothetical protein A2Y17_06645 [Clostridiales bacterium GWF2_38_85]HBL84893.1 CBS domain-containing protein [Clostridiales bacterium]